MKLSTKVSTLCTLITVFSSILCVSVSASVSTEASEASDTVSIIAATDIHYISQDLTDNGSAFTQVVNSGDGKVTVYCDALVEAFAEEVIEAAPDYLLITGDLTFNGELQSHKDLAGIFAGIEEHGTQVLVFPGNHDLNYSMARKYEGDELSLTDTCSAEEFREIYADFGYNQALECAPDSLSYVYPLDDSNWLLCIDVNTETEPYYLTEKTLAWAEEVLKKAQEQNIQVISASHQNLIGHNALFIDGYVMGRAKELRALYEKYGVELNLSGHMHTQHIASETNDAGNTLTDIATSSLSVAPCQYAELTIESASEESGNAKGSITYSTTPVDVSGWAQRQGLTDPNLLDFAKYAEDYFARIGGSKTEATLALYELPEETKQALIEGTNRLNKAYFSGRLDTLTDYDEILAQWQAAAPTDFFLIYILSLKDETFEDMTVWHN